MNKIIIACTLALASFNAHASTNYDYYSCSFVNLNNVEQKLSITVNHRLNEVEIDSKPGGWHKYKTLGEREGYTTFGSGFWSEKNDQYVQIMSINSNKKTDNLTVFDILIDNETVNKYSGSCKKE